MRSKSCTRFAVFSWKSGNNSKKSKIREYYFVFFLTVKVGLGRDGFPGRVRAGTPGIFPRGGETGREFVGPRGGFPDRKSPSPRLPEIIIISPHLKKFWWKRFILYKLLFNFNRSSVSPSQKLTLTLLCSSQSQGVWLNQYKQVRVRSVLHSKGQKFWPDFTWISPTINWISPSKSPPTFIVCQSVRPSQKLTLINKNLIRWKKRQLWEFGFIHKQACFVVLFLG